MKRAILMATAALLALLAAACSRAVPSPNEEANRLYQSGDYAAALELYQRAQAERPDLPELHYNAGNALHRLERYDRAAQEARLALSAQDPQLLAKAYYNLGNHLYRQGALRDALDAYKNALIHDPSDQEAKHNLEVVLARLAPPPSPGGQPPPQGGAPQEGEPAEGGGSPAEEGEAGQDQQGESGEAGEGPPSPGQRDSQGFTSPEEYRRTLAEALAGIEKDFTIEEALRVLEVLARRLEQRPSFPLPQASPTYRDW